MIHRRLIHTSAHGFARSNEDWWHLVYEEETSKIYVEHSWHYVTGSEREGENRMSLADYVGKGGAGAAKLQSILRSLFPLPS